MLPTLHNTLLRTRRLSAAELKPSKDQRKAVNRWNRNVLGEDYAKEAARLHPKSKKDKKVRQDEGFRIVSAVHEAELIYLPEQPSPAHRFEVTLEPDDFTEEKFSLYANYQEHVHHDRPDEITRSGFRRFLCSSPLRRCTRKLEPDTGSESSGGEKPSRKEQKLGSYHQLYRLDGRLIAIGVLDLLPHCVSGVYFIYHSDFEQWSFGKLSALREAALAAEAGHQWYYMGYYIHECQKMRYKGDYKPQMALDPETYEWGPLDGEFRDALGQRKYVSRSIAKSLAETGQKRKREEVEGDNSSNAGEVATSIHGNDSKILEGTRVDPVSEDGTEGDPYLILDPEEAADSEKSLLELRMPGVLTAEEVEAQVDLDHMKIQIGRRRVDAEDIVSWEEGSLTDPQSIKGIVAEFAACIGSRLTSHVVMKFGR
ncbi:MAG: Arginyl-tRNA--protein transferase 1 [Bogoriella megaspora]|nr:MAG: Arginyl-tRNA--protein transferase 1 [Bogoriella megaspora]